ncbi:hypothetical protein ABXT34_06550 [Ralstonia sp. SM1884_UCD616_TZ26]|uniref:hypothetical protein n=1 Tax=Ralstonia pseudosolanacearum TaxID=1310165 RepID=UPI003396EE3C
MFGPIRAVAIDDEPGHLLSITTGLSAVGIPCMGYWFDRDTSELQPPPPNGGHPFLRVVFTDLNLAELGGVPETAALWAAVVGVLKQLVSKSSGPYLLVFWTRIGAKATEVKEMLYARAGELDGIPCPIDVLELPKGPFLIAPPTGKPFDEGLRDFYAALHANINQLKQAIEGAVATDPQLNAVSAWESRAAEAAALAVNEVHRCARADEPDASKVGEALKKTLAKIAVAASGNTAAQAAPARALDAGMLDIVVDQFGASVDQVEYVAIVQEVIGATVAGDINFADNVAMYAELNTFFHVDREVGTAQSWDRGVVIAARPLGNTLGFRPYDFLTSEFLFPQELIPEHQRAEVPGHLQQIRQAASFVLVEIGADCDHAQDHDRTRRFLVGLEIPQDLIYLASPYEPGKLRNGALELLGPWKIDGAVKYLLVSCRRFWTWQGQTPPPSAPRYRLRAPLVEKLLHRYSSWSSRPGIVEFR